MRQLQKERERNKIEIVEISISVKVSIHTDQKCMLLVKILYFLAQ